jgi:type I restriction enzyme S subunit
MSEMKDIPKHWQEKSLGEIFTIERGGSPRPIEDFITNEKNGINWIKIGDTKNVVKYISQTKEKIKPEGAKRSRMVYEDDFLLSNSMSFGRPYIMKTTGCIHDGWLVIRKNEIIDNNYLYYILSSSFLYQQFSNLAKGSTVKNLNIEAVKQAVIRFPPLPEQQAIVAKIEELLSELENGKQQLQTAQKQLKVYRQSLLKWAFEGKLTNKNVKEGELPKGWKVEELKKITTVLGDGLHGTPKYSEAGDYYFINGNNLNNGKIEIKGNTKRVSVSEYNKYKKPLNENSILVSINGSLGYTAFYNNEKVVLGKSACYFNTIDSVSKHYVRYYITTSFFQSYAIQNATGSTIKNVGLKAMRELPIPLPPLSEQNLIVSELESKFTVCDKIEETISQSLQQAETLRQSILKQAFAGKLVAAPKGQDTISMGTDCHEKTILPIAAPKGQDTILMGTAHHEKTILPIAAPKGQDTLLMGIAHHEKTILPIAAPKGQDTLLMGTAHHDKTILPTKALKGQDTISMGTAHHDKPILPTKALKGRHNPSPKN